MMLDWLGERHNEPKLGEAGRLLERAIDTVFAAKKVLPFEFSEIAIIFND